ncbi:carbamoyltransferase N-terminal domain-containing protein [Thermodesulfobacteriota bacterium]
MAKNLPRSVRLLSAKSGGEDLVFLTGVWRMLTVGRELKRRFRATRLPRVHFVEHHLCHAASAFFVSPYERAAILTIDGRGESTTTMMATGS